VSALQGQGQGQAVDQVLNVIKEGVCISVFEGTGLLQRPLTIQEATQLIRESTPQGGGGRPLELSKNVHGSLQEITDRVSSDTAKVTAQLIVDSGAGVLGSLVHGPSEAPPAKTTPPIPPPAPLVAMGSTPMSSPDWDWGIYADGSMAAIARQPVTAAEFQAILTTGVRYDLTTPLGTGTAGAFINYGGTRSLVNGSCSLNVQINGSPSSSAQWWGSFNMAGVKNSDFLNFSVPVGSGRIDPLTGRLSIPAFQGSTHTASYNMQVSGQSFSGASITGESLTGTLVGPGTGAGAFTGVSGQFNFQHGSAASVNGVYGSDLR
jgi:hypothetical protein